MCGICNVVRCITGSNRVGRNCSCECGYDYRENYWREPCMNVVCANNAETSGCPCATRRDCGCGCGRRRRSGCQEHYDACAD